MYKLNGDLFEDYPGELNEIFSNAEFSHGEPVNPIYVLDTLSDEFIELWRHDVENCQTRPEHP